MTNFYLGDENFLPTKIFGDKFFFADEYFLPTNHFHRRIGSQDTETASQSSNIDIQINNKVIREKTVEINVLLCVSFKAW